MSDKFLFSVISFGRICFALPAGSRFVLVDFWQAQDPGAYFSKDGYAWMKRQADSFPEYLTV